MKLQYIVVIFIMCNILCDIMLFGAICISLLILVKIFQILTKISFFIYMGSCIWFGTI